MSKFIISGVMAAALCGASTIALAQTTASEPKEQPATNEQVSKPDTQAQAAESTKTPTVEAKDENKAAATAAPAESTKTAMTMTVEEGKKWIGKRVYSRDGSDIGEIAELKASPDGLVEYFHTDIGGFLGLGETSVQVKPEQFELRDEKLYLGMTQEEAKNLPLVTKN